MFNPQEKYLKHCNGNINVVLDELIMTLYYFPE